MKEPGYIYVMVNPSMEGLVKIGKTTREPEFRAKELSQATGVATPFYVAFSIFVSDCHSAEEFVHAVLEHKGFRNTANREFFQMPLKQAIEVLMLAEQELQKTAGESAPQGPKDSDKVTPEADEAEEIEAEMHPGREVFDQAIKIYYGEGDELEDQDEAVRLLYRAKALDYPAAFTSLAQHFKNLADEIVDCAAAWQTDAFLANREKALALLKEGAQKGHGRCWVRLASLYHSGWATRDHTPDPVSESKCWRNYFRSDTFREDNDGKWTKNSSGVGEYFSEDAEEGAIRISHSRYYLSRIMDGDLPMDAEIREILRPLKAEIIEDLRLSISLFEEPNDLPDGWDHTMRSRFADWCREAAARDDDPLGGQTMRSRFVDWCRRALDCAETAL